VVVPAGFDFQSRLSPRGYDIVDEILSEHKQKKSRLIALDKEAGSTMPIR
jgi:hypothetical protein